MTKEWAKDFYKSQYQMFSQYSDENYIEQQCRKIKSQASEIEKVLELGAGDGRLAAVLSNYVNSVTAIELVEEIELIEEMVNDSKTLDLPNVNYICGDFYQVSLDETFDLVLYVDGFGIGTDAEQVSLLKRIRAWLNDDGVALIDIYNPRHWEKAAGVRMSLGDNVTREYNFDHAEALMIDSWWHEGNEADKVSQYLKCYTPAEIEQLCQMAGLKIERYFPGGKMNYDTFTYYEQATLPECMMYRIKAVKA